ncbi:MAG TPA: beta-propeller fold lactonase family protein [Gemmatimonadaceae bacterium]|nr:beta-propeller fold lactonase family protein [Gemmatimonadaceae bacterium]
MRTILLASAILGFGSIVSAQGPALVVLNKAEASASIISLADGRTIASMPVGNGPHEVAVSPDGNWAVAANYGGGSAAGNSLTVLDLRNRKAVRTIDLGRYARPHGIAWMPDGKRVVVTSEQAKALVIVDVPNGRIDHAIETGQPGHLMTLAKDGHRAWTANIAAGSVSLVDLEKGTVVKTVVTGRGPEGHDVSPNGRELWAADRTLNRITVLDANTLDSLATIPTGEFPNRLHFTPDGKWVLVSNIRSGTVDVIDPATRRTVDHITFAFDSTRANPTMLGAMGRTPQPEGILIAPDGTRAWIALSAMNRIAEVDIASRRVVRYLTTGQEPDGMGYVAVVP